MASSDAGTSSGSEYQVFLSFRGPDTRVGFTDCLFHSLIDAGICVFRDDEELRAGERIGGSLLQAIDNSRIYIPVFSRNYASSQWCLRELARIMENTSKSEVNKVIVPIFYDVDPADVKLSTRLYHDAILNLQSENKLSEDQVDAWRDALKKVGAVKGWEVKKHKGHGELIKLIVNDVVEKLKTKHRVVTEHLVGIDDKVAAISNFLNINYDGVRLIKIYGMGGIGKTTLAKVIFNELSSHFGKCCCFLEDVRERSSRVGGLVDLQKKLLSTIGHPIGTISIDDVDYGMKRVEEVLCNKKVLIVLDDIDKNEQVEKLLGIKTIFRSGSRILITTRNKDLLQIHTPKYEILDYEMEVMSEGHALELFNKHAFKRDLPLDNYHSLSRKIVYSTGRLPLALEVIGSLLFSKPREIWEATLEKLRVGPHKDVFGKLRISYDALDFEDQQMFLDIACFFIGENKTNAIYMWKDCKFSPEVGVPNLISLSLIRITEDEKFWMHDQVRDLGREIVRLENPTIPEERSRIWILGDDLNAIQSRKMNNNVRALSLKGFDYSQSQQVGRYEHLRFLKLSRVTLVGDALNHLTELRWVSLDSVRVSEWTNIYLENAVVLEFSAVKFLDISRLQNSIKMSAKLKVFSLTDCGNITEIPDFSRCPNLERITFDRCPHLTKIDSSIGKLKCLIDLNIGGCNSLENLPEEIGDLVNLQYLSLTCGGVRKLPNSTWKLNSLRELRFMNKCDVNDLAGSWELPGNTEILHNLEVLEIQSLNLKGKLPSWIGSLPSLKELYLSHARVSEIPETISMLPCLQRIELNGCEEIQELPMLPESLIYLKVFYSSLQTVPDLSNLTNLVELELSFYGKRWGKHCSGELWWIGRLCQLTKLTIELDGLLVPAGIISLPLLEELNFHGLHMQNCSLLNLSYSDTFNTSMQEIQLTELQLPQLKDFSISDCNHLERLRLSSMRKLTHLKVSNCPMLVEIQIFGALESLESFRIQECNELISCEGRLIFPSRVFNKLSSLSVSRCDKILDIQVVGASESLDCFMLWDCPFLQSLKGLSYLKNLKLLFFHCCERLRVVEGLNELESLHYLEITGCGSLESKTKLPDGCNVLIDDSLGVKKKFSGSVQSFKHYKAQEEAARRQKKRKKDSRHSKGVKKARSEPTRPYTTQKLKRWVFSGRIPTLSRTAGSRSIATFTPPSPSSSATSTTTTSSSKAASSLLSKAGVRPPPDWCPLLRELHLPVPYITIVRGGE